jgi:hypothetical protein
MLKNFFSHVYSSLKYRTLLDVDGDSEDNSLPVSPFSSLRDDDSILRFGYFLKCRQSG